MTLAQLARSRDVKGVLDHACSGTPLRIQPEAIQEYGESMVCYPGDPHHFVTARLLPGPTRLCWRNDRYEYCIYYDNPSYHNSKLMRLNWTA